ncbi:uncharacterized protein LOC114474572 [Gouania willdenowi]|uniref:uncharacterized protein LOC114474572 n=1 Tax=Gouania willdenowi TaxID=441366 RepID=UPI0010569D0F|nr:uncharacterized protein LOC114474572 [Gouania willdenowi]
MEEVGGEICGSPKQKAVQLWPTSWSWFQTLSPFHPWSTLAPLGFLWSFCELETSQSLLDVFYRLLLVCFCWIILGTCIHVLKSHLKKVHTQEKPPEETQEIVVFKNRNKLQSCIPVQPPQRPGVSLVLTLALADSLLLCVLQEHLQPPNLTHIQALLSNLESVAHTLDEAGIRKGSRTLDVDEESNVLTDKLNLLCSYLQQRTTSLQTLVCVQAEFEAGVKDLQQNLENMWTELEKLHTGVTFTKEGGQGPVTVETAQTNTETLFEALERYRTKLDSCRTDLKDSTTLLQELSWSHSHISTRVNSSSESPWPEILLQSNMEQFDKVEESFVAVEQQTSTFQAHLEGLREAHSKEDEEPLNKSEDSMSQTTQCDHNRATPPQSLQPSTSTSSKSSSSSVKTGKDTKQGASLSLRERTALHFSSINRLRMPRWKK